MKEQMEGEIARLKWDIKKLFDSFEQETSLRVESVYTDRVSSMGSGKNLVNIVLKFEEK